LEVRASSEKDLDKVRMGLLMHTLILARYFLSFLSTPPTASAHTSHKGRSPKHTRPHPFECRTS
jgi:hypothetical protein